jgi:ABC-type Zn uptake system ZnuABC Zn-binding protein ZnuA
MMVVALAALGVAACGGDGAQDSAPAGRVPVVTTTVILADLVRNVGGEAVEVRHLIPSGADVHAFQSSPKDSVTIGGARVIVTNGAGLDGFLGPLIDGARRRDAAVIVASTGLKPRRLGDQGDGLENGGGDPHFWQDPRYAIHYVERIRDGLAKADPARAGLYRRNAGAYIEALRRLDEEIEATLKPIPPARRHLVTFHDAFGYFGERYGLRISAFLPSSGGDLSPGRVAEIVALVRRERVPAVFAEPQFSQDALRQVARDAGARVGVINSDALSDETPSYVEMMRANAKSLVTLLGGATP